MLVFNRRDETLKETKKYNQMHRKKSTGNSSLSEGIDVKFNKDLKVTIINVKN